MAASTSDPNKLPAEIAKSLYNSRTGFKATRALERVIIDVQTETQVSSGANVLLVKISDPDLSVMSEGLFAMEEVEGLFRLPPIKIAVDGVQWQLVDISWTTGLQEPNVVLEFQNEAAVRLRRLFGPIKAVRSKTDTRAQFLQRCAKAVKGVPVTFFCPLLHEVQPVKAEAESLTPEEREEVKGKGLVNPSQLGLNPEQLKNADTILEVGDSHKAGELATLAALATGLAESNLENKTQVGGPAQGVFQMEPFLSAAEHVNPFDVAEAATAFFTKYGTYKGAIEAAQKNPNAKPYEIAQMTQRSGAGEASKGKANYGAKEELARKIYSAYGGVTKKVASKDKPYEFAIGSEENYWAGMQKLAQEVGWLLWFVGNDLNYMRSTEIIQQKPLAVIDVVNRRMATSVTVDEFGVRKHGREKTYENAISQFTGGLSETEEKAKAELQKLKGKAKEAKVGKRKSKNPAAALTSECTIQLVCQPGFVRAGDVLILKDPHDKSPWYTSGYSGRWVVTNATRSVFNVYTEVTLALPGASSLPMPIDEPEHGESSSSEAANGTSEEVGGGGVVAAAQKALKLEQQNHSYYEYDEIRPMPSSLFGGPNPIKIDCSGFATLCYKEAKEPDPNGLNYNGSGFTGTLEAHGMVTQNPKPGDLVFWRNPDHVAVYIGGGKIISMGTEGDPTEETVAGESTAHEALIGYRTYKG